MIVKKEIHYTQDEYKARMQTSNLNQLVMDEELNKDLCKSCEHYWQDFPMPLEYYESHCEIADRKHGFGSMDDVVPYPCLKCPFNKYSKKK